MLAAVIGAAANLERGRANMKVLEQQPSVAVDTTVPGLTRRRVWTAPDVTSHSLLALTFTKLYLAPAGANLRPDIAASIVGGADLDAIFGPLGTVDLSRVTRVRFDLLANSLTLEYPHSEGSGAIRLHGGFGNAQVVLEFANHEMADEVYTKIWRRLGDRVELKPYRRDYWDLGRTPAALMAGVLIATVVSVVAANAAADAGPTANPLVGGLQRLDWRWLCGAGGIALALLQIWIYRLFTQPPTHLELTARFPQERR